MTPIHVVPPCKEPVSVIYEDEYLLLVNKPAGLLSVPGRHPENRDCVISRLQQDYPKARIVHRLDLDTSGILVIALDADTHRALNKQFELREIDKSYTAVVAGLVENGGAVELPLICDWPNRPLQKVDYEQGRHALTHYDLLSMDTEDTTSRLCLRPVTGRSHQLRVHMAAIGHPILGCTFYAPESIRTASDRLLLHATSLRFTHPVSGVKMDITSPPPF